MAMTTQDFRASLQRLGLRQIDAAPILGMSAGHVNRCAQGKRPVAPPVERLLWALERDPALVGAVAQAFADEKRRPG